MRIKLPLLLASASALCLGATLSAQIIVNASNSGRIKYFVGSGETDYSANDLANTGFESGLNEIYNGVFSFELPDLGGESLDTAVFSFYLIGWSNDPAIGVWGEINADSGISTDSYGWGETQPGTEVATDVIPWGTPAVQEGVYIDVDVTNYLSGVYAASQFSLFRLSVPGASPDGIAYIDTDGFLGNGATLTLTTTSAVPEPSTYALIFGLVTFGGLGIVRRRRRS
jgi:hypothetical protein